MDNAVGVLALVGNTRGGVLILLCRNLQARNLENRLNFGRYAFLDISFIHIPMRSELFDVRWSKLRLILPVLALAALIQ